MKKHDVDKNEGPACRDCPEGALGPKGEAYAFGIDLDNFIMADSAKLMASVYIGSLKPSNERAKQYAIESVLAETCKEVLYRAGAGFFDADSPNLADPKYYVGTTFDDDEMEAILGDAVKDYFTNRGYVVDNHIANILTIKWGTDEQIELANKREFVDHFTHQDICEYKGMSETDPLKGDVVVNNEPVREVGKMVLYNGSVYVCISDNNWVKI